MNVDPKQLKALQRLREKYQENETALDALLYVLVTDRGARVEDVSSRIKDAIAFCRGKDGEKFYEKVVRVLDRKNEDDVYDYSSAWAKAAKHKEKENGPSSLEASSVSVSPELLAMQALSRFKKNI